MMRSSEPGWIDIGKSDGRRSLWVRLNHQGEVIELCAGREGDDDYARVERSNPCFSALLSVFESAVYAAELAAPSGSADK